MSGLLRGLRDAWRIGSGPQVPPPRRLGFGHRTWLTSLHDGVAHLVDDEEASSPTALGSGVFQAICGATVTAAPLVAPGETTCTHCVDVARRPGS